MLKKQYETPVAEKICFQYAEQVTASGGGRLSDVLGPYLDYLVDSCTSYLPKECYSVMNIFG